MQPVDLTITIEAVSTEAAEAAVGSIQTLMSRILPNLKNDDFITETRGASGNGYMVIVQAVAPGSGE
jgi:hypothetical protein